MLQETDSVTGDCQCYRRLTVLQEIDSVTGD